MAMTLIKKTTEYKIFKRGDGRFAVQNAQGKSVNGEEKVRALVAEDLIKVTLPSTKAVAEEVPEAVAEEVLEAAVEEVAEADEAPEVAVEETAEQAPAAAVDDAPEAPAEEPAEQAPEAEAEEPAEQAPEADDDPVKEAAE